MQRKNELGRRIFGCIMLVCAVLCIWAEYAIVAPMFIGALGVAALLD